MSRPVFISITEKEKLDTDEWGIPKIAYSLCDDNELPNSFSFINTSLCKVYLVDINRKCPVCEEFKSRDDFYPKKKLPGARFPRVRYKCKSCTSIELAKYKKSACLQCGEVRRCLVEEGYCSVDCYDKFYGYKTTKSYADYMAEKRNGSKTK